MRWLSTLCVVLVSMAVPAQAQDCPPGMTASSSTGGNCCWPGQGWHPDRGCLGQPTSCPAGFEVSREGCVEVFVDCPAGMVVMADQQNCCWPGQVWHGACSGAPSSCPDDHVTTAQGCSPEPGCLQGMELTVDRLHCCWRGQAHNGTKCVGDPVGCPRGYRPEGENCALDLSLPAVMRVVRDCEKSHGDTCMEVAEQATVRGDEERALFWARVGCSQDDRHCLRFAELLVSGTSRPDRLRAAATLRRRSCDAGVAAGCEALAGMYDLGLGVTLDPVHARFLRETARRARKREAADSARQKTREERRAEERRRAKEERRRLREEEERHRIEEARRLWEEAQRDADQESGVLDHDNSARKPAF